MITSPLLSAVRSSQHGGGGGGGGGAAAAAGGGGARDLGSSNSNSSSSSGSDLPWQSGHTGISTSGGNCSSSSNSSSKPFFHSVPPSDPLRQANRLPIKVLKMLTARTGHILHPEYLQPLPSTPVSPIELDAKKSPLALLAQTCSQIGKPDPSPSSKLSSVTSNGSDKDSSKSGPLKLSDIGVEDKSSFKPYSKPGADKKEASAGVGGGNEKSGFRVPSATCQPFTPRTGSPTSSASACSPGLLPGADGKGGDADKKDSSDGCGAKAGSEPSGGHGRLGAGCGGITAELSQAAHESAKGLLASSSSSSSSSSASSDSSSCGGSITVTSSSSAAAVLSSGLVAPVSPYKPGQTVFPLPPAGMSYPGSLAGRRVPAVGDDGQPVPRPLLPELPLRQPLGRRRQRFVRARPGAQVRLPADVPDAPAAHGALVAERSHAALAGRPPLVPLRLHAPQRPPAAHLQLGVGQRTVRQALRHLGRAAQPLADSHGLPGHGQAAVQLPELHLLSQRGGSGHGLPHAHPHHCCPRKPRHPGFAQPAPRLGTQQPLPPLFKEPLAHPGSSRACPGGHGTVLLPLRTLWAKTDDSVRFGISVSFLGASFEIFLFLFWWSKGCGVGREEFQATVLVGRGRDGEKNTKQPFKTFF
uniref:Zinc finger protein 503 n=1 Tax=Podarcis muralis TaxID=64176 RepID=A0A670HV52_PODMU